MSATALDAANAVGDALGKQVGRLAATRPADSPPATTCAAPWTHYCASVIRAAEYARSVDREGPGRGSAARR